MEFEILFEDRDIVAINKPAGVMVHGDGRSDEQTVVDWFLQNYPDARDVGEEAIVTQDGEAILRPGVVHRLDKETSGVLLLAKTDQGHTHLKKQFQDRTISKTYHALVYGELKQESGVIDTPIGRSKTFAKWTAIPKAMRGKEREAETRYRVLGKSEGFSYLELTPKTGRTHQIRVHMQYLNYPLVADRVYAGKRYDPEHSETTLGFTRHALHAHSIEFQDLNAEMRSISAPLPADFQNALEKLHLNS